MNGMLFGILHPLKVARENVNREDIIADNMLRQTVNIKIVESHNKSQKHSHKRKFLSKS